MNRLRLRLLWHICRWHVIKACDAREASHWYRRYGFEYEYLREWREYQRRHALYRQWHSHHHKLWVELGGPITGGKP